MQDKTSQDDFPDLGYAPIARNHLVSLIITGLNRTHSCPNQGSVRSNFMFAGEADHLSSRFGRRQQVGACPAY